MSYATEQAAAARTPQAILRIGVPYCANWYAQDIRQLLGFPQEFDNAGWTKSGGCAVVADSTAAPDGTTTADTVNFAAAGDNISAPWAIITPVSNSFTLSVWLMAAAAGTITLDIKDGGAEITSVQVNVSTTWTRFWSHRLFTAGAVAAGSAVRIRRQAGDLASVFAWGANYYQNPGNPDKELRFPYASGFLASVSTCTAADAGDGARCYYTAPTCQDLAHYNAGHSYEQEAALRGIREYGFCLKDAPLPFKGGDLTPSLDSFDQAAQEIDSRRGITKAEKVSYRLSDDSAPGTWDVGKQSDGAKVNTARGQGTFFRRFLPIHKNYSNPNGYARLSVGYVASGLTESDFRLRLSGPILDVSLDAQGRVTIRASDSLDGLKKKVPTKISSTNLLKGALPAAATTMYVDDPTEIDNPPTDGAYKVTLLIRGVEKVNVTAKNATTGALTIERGRWGTAAVDHTDNSTVAALVEFGTEQVTPASPVLGKNPIDCAYEILRRAGIAAADIDTATLYAQRDTWLSSSINTTTGVQSGVLFRRTLTDPVSLENLLFSTSDDSDAGICESVLLWLWQGEDRKITGKVFAPIGPTDTVASLTDAANFIAKSVEVTDDNDARLSRVIYGWDLTPGATGDQLGDYLQQQARILSDEEAPGFYGAERDRIIKSKWLSGVDTATARTVAGRIINRYRNGSRSATAALEAKDDDSVSLGAFVKVSTGMLQTDSGATDVDRVMQVAKKEHLSQESGQIKVSLVDTGLFGRFGFWSALADALPDYDSASEAQRLCGFWADSNGKVGTAFDPAYGWW